MVVLITIIHIAVCLFLIIVVLLQSGKSGDISAAFGGMGSRRLLSGPERAATVLSQATTWSAIIFMVTSITTFGFRFTPQWNELGAAGSKAHRRNRDRQNQQRRLLRLPAPVPQQ